MNTANIGVTKESFILGDDGRYVSTILAETHALGTNVFVAKATHRGDDLTFENVLISYMVDINGDIKIFADEPISMRLTILSDI